MVKFIVVTAEDGTRVSVPIADIFCVVDKKQDGCAIHYRDKPELAVRILDHFPYIHNALNGANQHVD